MTITISEALELLILPEILRLKGYDYDNFMKSNKIDTELEISVWEFKIVMDI